MAFYLPTPSLPQGVGGVASAEAIPFRKAGWWFGRVSQNARDAREGLEASKEGLRWYKTSNGDLNVVRLACVNRVTSCAVVQPKRLHVREPRRSRSHWMVGEKDREVGYDTLDVAISFGGSRVGGCEGNATDVDAVDEGEAGLIATATQDGQVEVLFKCTEEVGRIYLIK
ncbi:hypothetical protein M407DRAFT_10777 [Tulasnella calospora MUT 4182]|uniref:Uncharacterized protein n=1 Tax=Tulasnella calospora MUT 4182 TaxID=1051891 RepID=A0A0C3LGS4_9AGAM|nr:hypothetical protein M407DRAFT_10777 [Tulasnella calospora MUT 4182]